MWIKALAIACATVVMLGLTAPIAAAYSPHSGPTFNRPIGTKAEKKSIITHLNRTIASTHRGQTIRIAVYSFNYSSTADALVDAHRRGVNVQMVLNDHWLSTPIRRLQRVLGTDITHRSFARICRSGCRSSHANLHSKFYLFTKAGTSSNIVMVGSSNVTTFGAGSQWNDLYTNVGNKTLLKQYVTIFNQMKLGRPVADPYVVRSTGVFTSRFLPHPKTTMDNDPAYRMLRRVRCHGADGGSGIRGRTVIRISMHTWSGERGIYLAQKVKSLWDRGCSVRVIYGFVGYNVKNQLTGWSKHGRMPVHDGGYDRDQNGKNDLYTHQKVVFVSGHYGKDSSHWRVWTGSANWVDKGVRGDEVIFSIARKSAYAAYKLNFDDIWANGSRSVY